MKKLCLLTLCFISQFTFAQLPLVDVQGFTGQYTNSLGQATARVFKYEDQDLGSNAKFSIFKQAGVFFLKTPDDEIQLDGLPESINDLKELTFQNIGVSTTDTKVVVDVPTLSGKTDEASVALKSLKLSCSGQGSEAELRDYVLDKCFNKLGIVNIGSISSTDSSMKNLRLVTNNGRLSFSAKTKGVTAKGSGTTEYRASENKIVIRVDKVKVGFLKVTGKFFKELKEKESEKLIVKRPYIEILLD